MKDKKFNLIQITPEIFEIPKTDMMRVKARIYGTTQIIDQIDNNCFQQVINVAHLPGIVKYSLAMPDIHLGYGFTIGGVAATDYNNGVISPGGVGYDINCGVRLIATNLFYQDIKSKIKGITSSVFNNVPAGIGSHSGIRKLSKKELRRVIVKGAKWAIENNFGTSEQLEMIEENGCFDNADPTAISEYAYQRGLDQVGTLGSGNHFIEMAKVDKIFDKITANKFNLTKNQIVILLHTGSRGFGYQVCDDYIRESKKSVIKYGINLPDKQLACAPLSSPEGQRYLHAMSCAANYAFANRQVIYSLIEYSIMHYLNISPATLGFRLIYDISHNIAKIEDHFIDGKQQKLCVHRKGATRAFGPGNDEVPEQYRKTGQPVLIPGDFGTGSYLCVGTQKAMDETFGSSCHGAGRLLSRKQALKKEKTLDLNQEIANTGVFVLSARKKTIAEEMPYAYKNVDNVVNTMHNSGILKKVLKSSPLSVIKG